MDVHAGNYKIIDGIETDDDLIDLALMYGKPARHTFEGAAKIDRLRVVNQLNATPNSLSSRFGDGAFPFHTDQAHTINPPRFVILNLSEGDISRPTYLMPFAAALSEVESTLLSRAVWRCNTGKEVFYTTCIFEVQGQLGFRYDPACMEPVNKPAKIISDKINGVGWNEPLVSAINWRIYRACVIPNWEYLHARGTSNSSNSCNRLLKRIYVE